MKTNNWKEFAIKNVKWIVVIAAVLILAIVAAVSSQNSAKKAEEQKKQEQQEKEEQEKKEEQKKKEEEAKKNDLVLDQYPEVNTLINNYYTTISNNDMEGLKKLVTVLTQETQDTVKKEREYIEGYSGIKCYTKRGPAEKSYVAYVEYSTKFISINTPVPGLATFYICTKDDGTLVIETGDLSNLVKAYLSKISEDKDVIDLMGTVEQKLMDAINSDAALKEFVDKLKPQAAQ